MSLNFVVIVGNCSHVQDQVAVNTIVEDCFKMVDETLNNWNERSQISQLNCFGEDVKEKKVHPFLSHLLSLSHTFFEESGGKFDVTCSPLLKLWKQTLRKEKRAPFEEEMEQILPQVCSLSFSFTKYDEKNWEQIGWDKCIQIEGERLKWKKRGCEIDFGSIGKGFTVDLIFEKLLEAKFEDVYVDWGGDIKCGGSLPHRKWRTSIVKPPSLPFLFKIWQKKVKPSKSNLIHTLFFEGKPTSICTSGDYSQVPKFRPIFFETKSFSSRLNSLVSSTFLTAPLTSSSRRAKSLSRASLLFARVVHSLMPFALRR